MAALYVDKGLRHVEVFCRVCLFPRLEVKHLKRIKDKSLYLGVNVYSAEHQLGTLSRSNWSLEVLVFEEREKAHMTPSPRIEPGPHWC